MKCKVELNFSTINNIAISKENNKFQQTKLSFSLFFDTHIPFSDILITIFYLASKVRSITFSRLALLLFESRSNIHLHSSPVHRDASCFSSGSPRAACRVSSFLYRTQSTWIERTSLARVSIARESKV